MPNTSVARSIAAMPQSVRQVAQGRVNEVHALQRRFGMEPRDDSTLTLSYATGKISNATALEVTKELVIVDRIHKKTSYAAVLEEVMRKITYFLKERYPHISWTDMWSISRFYIPEMVKLYCIRMQFADKLFEFSPSSTTSP